MSAEPTIWEELKSMGTITVLAGIIGLCLLVYLFYVLFRGEEL
ncbi:potassium-transporting ATPase subunit F [Alkalibacterium sp. AK22]